MKLIISIIAVIVIIIAILAYWLGAFAKLNIEEAAAGPYVLVYEEHVGPYSGIKAVQDGIYYRLLNEEQISTTKGFGIYYDNPKVVDKEKLRSIGGVILEEEYADRIPDLEKNFKLKRLGEGQVITTSIPFKNPLSVMVGIFKVYPAIERYVEEKGYDMGEMMEIYDVPNKKIIYLMPLK